MGEVQRKCIAANSRRMTEAVRQLPGAGCADVRRQKKSGPQRGAADREDSKYATAADREPATADAGRRQLRKM